MKTLTAAEALIALGNGEKVTSDSVDENIKFLQVKDGFVTDGLGDTRIFEVLGKMLKGANLRIYEEFTYPMWFKSKHTRAVLKFTGLKDGEVTERGELAFAIGDVANDWVAHTDTFTWEQVEEPKKMIKVALFAVFKKGWYQTQDYFKSEESCLENHSYATLAKRLDYTEIEVEDY